MTSLRRSTLKSERSFRRLWNEIHSREGPTSSWPDRVKIATKLQISSRRATAARKRLHTAGMPQEKAIEARKKIYGPFSKGHERILEKEAKEISKRFSKGIREQQALTDLGYTMTLEGFRKGDILLPYKHTRLSRRHVLDYPPHPKAKEIATAIRQQIEKNKKRSKSSEKNMR